MSAVFWSWILQDWWGVRACCSCCVTGAGESCWVTGRREPPLTAGDQSSPVSHSTGSCTPQSEGPACPVDSHSLPLSQLHHGAFRPGGDGALQVILLIKHSHNLHTAAPMMSYVIYNAMWSYESLQVATIQQKPAAIDCGLYFHPALKCTKPCTLQDPNRGLQERNGLQDRGLQERNGHLGILQPEHGPGAEGGDVRPCPGGNLSLHSLQDSQRQQLAREVSLLLQQPKVPRGVSQACSRANRALYPNTILGVLRTFADNNSGKTRT